MEATLDTLMTIRMKLTKIIDPVPSESISESIIESNSKSNSESSSESSDESSCESSDDSSSDSSSDYEYDSDEGVENEPSNAKIKSKYVPALTWKEHYLRDHLYIT